MRGKYLLSIIFSGWNMVILVSRIFHGENCSIVTSFLVVLGSILICVWILIFNVLVIHIGVVFMFFLCWVLRYEHNSEFEFVEC